MAKNNQSSAEDLENEAHETVHNLRETGEDLQNRLGEFWETSKEQAASCARATDRAIRENPWQSVGIAFGVGLLFGLLIGGGSGRRYSDED